jgi:AcrR family transcriptional regulator
MKLPLRERKKIETRRRIVEVADALFRKKGFANTTLDEIADAANIHKITVLRYFPSKESIAFDYADELHQSFQAELEARRGSVIDCWRGYIFRTSAVATQQHRLIERMEFNNSDPALLSYQLRLDARYQRTLSRAFSEEAGVDPDTDVLSRTAAALLVAGNASVAQMTLKNGSYDNLQACCLAVVDLGEAFLRGHERPGYPDSTPSPRAARA